MEFIIGPEGVGQRLDKFLSSFCPDFSRSQIQKLIKNKEVTVNKKHQSASYCLKQGDKVFLPGLKDLQKEEQLLFEEQKKRFPKVDIVADAPDYLVVNKPAGVLSHGSGQIKEFTLIDFLTEKYPEVATAGEDEWKQGLVHRLDRDVSGLLLVAKNQKTFSVLKKQFQDRQIKKEYTALVHGILEKDRLEIDFDLKRAKDGYKMAAIPKGSLSDVRSREAKTIVDLLDQRKEFSLIRVRIVTGRTHQIRVHLFATGYPLVGDSIYTNKKAKLKNQKINDKGFLKDRIFLVADNLCFTDLSGETKEFSLDLPEELQTFWDSLI